VFLHVGSETVVRLADIVAILDAGTRDASVATKELIQLAEAEGRLVDVARGQCKSFVVTEDAVYLCPISSTTLKRRGALLGEGLVMAGPAR